MAAPRTISLDAMGGDQGPAVVVPGAALALERHPDAQLSPGWRSSPHTAASRPASRPGRSVAHRAHRHRHRNAGQAEPGRAAWARLQHVACAGGGAEREADVAVSAGNTGALMAMAKLILRTMPGIERPGDRRPVADGRAQQHRARPGRQHRRHRPPACRLCAYGRGHGAGPVRHRAAACGACSISASKRSKASKKSGKRMPGSRKTIFPSTTAALWKATRSARASWMSWWSKGMRAISRSRPPRARQSRWRLTCERP